MCVRACVRACVCVCGIRGVLYRALEDLGVCVCAYMCACLCEVLEVCCIEHWRTFTF